MYVYLTRKIHFRIISWGTHENLYTQTLIFTHEYFNFVMSPSCDFIKTEIRRLFNPLSQFFGIAFLCTLNA